MAHGEVSYTSSEGLSACLSRWITGAESRSKLPLRKKRKVASANDCSPGKLKLWQGLGYLVHKNVLSELLEVRAAPPCSSTSFESSRMLANVALQMAPAPQPTLRIVSFVVMLGRWWTLS